MISIILGTVCGILILVGMSIVGFIMWDMAGDIKEEFRERKRNKNGDPLDELINLYAKILLEELECRYNQRHVNEDSYTAQDPKRLN